MCNNKVMVWVSNESMMDSVEIEVRCGDIVNSGHSTKAVLCPTCEKEANKVYPQGWRYSPGDTCKHGIYVKGDYDCACPYCEFE